MIYTYEIVNIEFRYVIELCENGLYSLKFQKWDDGKSVNRLHLRHFPVRIS